jgi:hypothetical protein
MALENWMALAAGITRVDDDRAHHINKNNGTQYH